MGDMLGYMHGDEGARTRYAAHACAHACAPENGAIAVTSRR
jgi:hypothetical protein